MFVANGWKSLFGSVSVAWGWKVVFEAGRGRMIHLDAVRVVLMSCGVVTHATMIGSNAVFDAITFVSGLFRMKAFFLISGFFGALVLSRRSAGQFLSARLPALLWPLAAGTVVVVPFTLWLMAIWHHGPIGVVAWLTDPGWLESLPDPVGPLLHLWFLVVLIGFTLLLPPLMAVLRTPVVAVPIEALRPFTQRLGLWGHVAVIALLMMLSRSAYLALFGPDLESDAFGWLVSMLFHYAPWFGFGALAFRYRWLFDAFETVSGRHLLGGLLLCAGIFTLALQFGDGWPGLLRRALFWPSRSGMVVFGFAGLVQLCRHWLDRETPLLRMFVDSALTFYLIHIALIFLLALLIGRDAADSIGIFGLFVLLVLVVPPLGVAVHALVVGRVPVLDLLFRGKRTAPRGSHGARAGFG
ncbi:glucan biosynthesis protein [Polymorphobacter multimanifer]|nr:glucan biosynthesis protein [Polymorphobacter multimanifer]